MTKRTLTILLLALLLAVYSSDALKAAAIHLLRPAAASLSVVMFKLARVSPTTVAPYTIKVINQAGAWRTIYLSEGCSGIRSLMPALILALAVGYLYLRRWWTQALLLLATAALVVIINAERIAVLTLLSFRDIRWLTGIYHQEGSLLAFAVTLSLLAGVTHFLRRAETHDRFREANASYCGASRHL
jgi:exosortase/archaeosortase family protein